MNLILLLSTLSVVVVAQSQCSTLQKNILFKFYHQNQLVRVSNSFSGNLTNIPGCSPGQPWVIIIHGFTESCETNWVAPIISQFAKYRGGCIVCMDYSKYSGVNFNLLYSVVDYFNLVVLFEPITKLLIKKLNQFTSQNFTYETGHIFAHSYGSQLALEAGKRLNGQLSGIDACDPAGPGFYPPSSTIFINNFVPNYLAAKNVQCIHTSMIGTMGRDCSQDWVMGECGLNQQVANGSIGLSHHYCPVFYASAFDHVFGPVDNKCCVAKNIAKTVPEGYRMGYMQKDKGMVNRKVLFSPTYANYPYNRPQNIKREL